MNDNSRGLAGLCGMLLGFIGGFALACYGGSKVAERDYKRGYEKGQTDLKLGIVEDYCKDNKEEESEEKEEADAE